MERLSGRLASYLARNIHCDEEQRAVIAYGLGALIQIGTLLCIISVLGAVFHCFAECMILFWGVGLFRRCAGGAHASTYWGCLVVSVLSIFLMALLARFCIPHTADFWVYALTMALPCFSICGYLCYRRAPIPAPNKPIRKPEKIVRLRKQCFLMLGLYGVAALVLMFFANNDIRLASMAFAIFLAVLWQAFTMTKAASCLIDRIDKIDTRVS